MNPRLGQALAGLGALLVTVGVVGLVTGDDGDDVTGAPTTTARAEDPGGTTSSAPVPIDEQIGAFYAEFGAAFGSGDVDFLFDRLDPAVLELYGADQCREHVASILGERTFEIGDVGAPAPWDFGTEREGKPLIVEDAVPVDVVQKVDDREIPSEAHVTVREGTVRWFTDCGAPV